MPWFTIKMDTCSLSEQNETLLVYFCSPFQHRIWKKKSFCLTVCWWYSWAPNISPPWNQTISLTLVSSFPYLIAAMTQGSLFKWFTFPVSISTILISMQQQQQQQHYTPTPPSAVVVRWFSACRGWCCEAVIKGQQWQNRSGMGVSRTGPASPREITLFCVRRDDIMTDGDQDVGTEGRKCYLTMAPNGSRQTHKHAYTRLT